MRKKYSIQILTTLLALVLLGGCKKMVEIEAPKTEVLATTVFSSDASALVALAGMYGSMLTGRPFNNYLTQTNSMLADEMAGAYVAGYLSQYPTNTMQATDGQVAPMWSDLYNYIYQANSIIENVQASTGMSDSIKNQFTGEAKFVRALCHFYLVNLYGPVPLITTTDVTKTAYAPRSDSATVYQQIIADLVTAQSLLASDYHFSGGQRTRPNKYVAAALLARVYLYAGRYADAETQAGLVISNSTMYSLLPSATMANTFLKNSVESIYSLNTTISSGAVTINDGVYYNSGFNYGALFGPSYVFTTGLANSFETGDLRKTNWAGSFTYSGNTFYYPAKNKFYYGATATEYITLLRLGEQYLIRAEARAQQNNLSGAQSDLNTIRNRAGLANTTAVTQSALLAAIYNERRVELFFEQGHRWLDLKRTGQSNTVLGALKPATWKATAVLYPIPQTAITNNPALTQNAGY